jgi:hypothetical protein
MPHASWGPACQAGTIKTDFSVDGTRFPGGVRYELVDLVTRLVRECKHRGYRFGTASDPSYGCWGYSCRRIAGSQTMSNHAWGLAIDINAPSNPYTSPLHTDMPSWMPDLWNDYGFRWGGDYTGRKDAMHYEQMASVQAVVDYTHKAIANNLGGSGAGVQPPPPRIENRPGTPAFPLPPGYYYGPLSGPKESISGSYSGDRVSWKEGLRTAQRRLNEHTNMAGLPPIVADGVYGPATKNRVQWFQSARGLATDGLIGPKTWTNLWN